MKLQRLLSYVRKAVDDYGMISEGDNIAVGVSGGKDSLALLYALAHLRRFYPNKFNLCALTVSLGFDGMDFSETGKLCDTLEVPYHVVETDIAEIIFDDRKEQNPCSLCSKMRKGALNDKALSLGFDRIALGHNKDDVVETFFLSLFYEGRLNSFSPITYMDRKQVHVIRPLVYTPEKDVVAFAKKYGLPITKNACPVDGYTKRERVKELVNELGREFTSLDEKVFGAIVRAGISGW